jgi:diacylglycerol kinase family enzyme
MDQAFSPRPPARRIRLIANPNSGGNRRDGGAVDRIRAALGEGTEIKPWQPGTPLRWDEGDRPDIVVAAGGDGTVSAVAAELIGTGTPLAVLPLGTFNYFARGLGYSEDPEVAARQILAGSAHDIRVGTVNGTPFLNNASLGLYPHVLRERERTYGRWGRHRLAAHWSVLRSFMRFRHPLSITLDRGEGAETRQSALVFVARSAYQLERFGIEGGDVISDDAFAVLVARATTRARLARVIARLTARRAREGRDYDMLRASDMTIALHGRDRALLAHDGEKRVEQSPFRFRMDPRPLTVVLPGEAT